MVFFMSFGTCRSPSLCDADDVGNVNEVDLFAPAPSSETFGLHTHR